MQIGVFDSGVGGATVLAAALRLLPEEDYLYYADTLHTPYGEKSKDEVRRYIFESVEQMTAFGIKALVIACNTATSIAVRELRARYRFPIIGMEPAVKPAVLRHTGGEQRVMVFATSLTLKEDKFLQLVSTVDQSHIVDYMALPQLVELAERHVFGGVEVEQYLQHKLKQLDWSKYGTIVLGCTHFPLFKASFRKYIREDIDIIDGAEGTVKHLCTVLERKKLAGGGSGSVLYRSSAQSSEGSAVFEAALKQAQAQLKLV